MDSCESNSLLATTAIVSANSVDFLRHIFNCYRKREPVVLVGSVEAAETREGITINTTIVPQPGGGWLRPPYEMVRGPETAQISFTSGTQGKPKGIILSYDNLANVVDRLTSEMKIDSSIREYIAVPVYHSFGFGRARTCLNAGGEIYVPDRGFNPLELSRMIAADEVNAFSAVPTLCRLILRESRHFTGIGHKIKWIEIGSQYMSREEKEKMKSIFPNAIILMHYGLTEASRSAFLDISNTEGPALGSVGKAMFGIEIRTDDLGRICIKGEHVARRMVLDGQTVSVNDADGWLVTSDKGEIRDGYLYFIGRLDDIINSGGVKISPDLIERRVLAEIGKQSGLAVVKVEDRVRGNGMLVVCDNTLSDSIYRVEKETKKVLSEINVNLGNSLHFDHIEEIPVTYNGKIKRKELSELFQKKFDEIKSAEAEAIKGDGWESLVELIEGTLNIKGVEWSDSVIGLGVDSLGLINASLAVEEYLGYLPENWAAMTFEELTALNKAALQTNRFNVSLRKPVLICATAIVLMLAGETLLQARSHIKYGRSVLTMIADGSLTVFNDELGVKTYRPHAEIVDRRTGEVRMKINSLGLRSPELPPKQPDELRVAVVGSSTVAGLYSDRNEETFSQIMAGMLEERLNRPVNVINGGIQGYRLADVLTLTRKLILPLKPDIVALYVNFNDIASVCTSGGAGRREHFEAPTLEMPNWVLTSPLLRKNTVFLRTAPVSGGTYIDPANVDISSKLAPIEALMTEVSSLGIRPLLITNARSYNNVDKKLSRKLAENSIYQYGCLNYDGLIEIGKRLNSYVREIAQRNNITMVDLEQTMPGGNEYFADSGHFTLKGENFVANEVGSAILAEEK